MKRKGLLTTILLSFIAFILVAYSLVAFNGTVNYELEKSIKSTLSDLANQQQLSLDRQLESMMYNIVSIAETLPIIGVEQEEIFDYLDEKRMILNMESIMIVDKDGVMFLDAAIVDDVHERDFFKESMKGEVYASEPYISKISEKEVVLVSAPIYDGGEVDGVLAVEYCTNYLTTLLTTFTDSRGLNLLLNSDSEILLSTSSFEISFDAFKNAQFDEGLTFEQIKEEFNNGNSGSITYTMFGDRKFAEFRPIAINNWILFFEISEESLAASVQSISSSMLFTSILLIVIAFITIIYVVISKNNAAKVLEKAAYYDELTGIPNLLRFKMLVKQAIEKDPNADYAMVKFDLMNFKAINEMFGFKAGDKVIQAIAATGTNVSDESFFQARIASDEFMLFGKYDLFKNLEVTSKGYEKHFNELLPELEDHQFKFRYGRYFITHEDIDTIDVNDMVQRTNTAHSFAKNNNFSDICDYDESFTKRVLRETEISNKMDKALVNEEFKVYLQPKYDVLSGEIMGAEALVRWIEPDGNMIFPNDFIPLFERNGFIVNLDFYMIKKVCQKLGEWCNSGRECIPVSVNFSRLHLSNRSFVSEIKRIVDSYNVDPKYIEIELTESTVMENEKELSILLKELHKEGFLASIDDFGSGYSSLGMLKDFNVDTLKLDRSFFVEIDDNDKEDSRGELVVESIVRLADSLGMKTIAEGIEEEAQVEFLKKIKCDAAQGYYYAKPLPVAEFEKLYFEDEK